MRGLLLAMAIISQVATAAAAADPTQFLTGGGSSLMREWFLRDYPRALGGDYEAQRNVAHSFSFGANGAVKVDRVRGCAWRMVIMVDDHGRAGLADKSNLDYECGRLTPREGAAAEAMAKGILADRVFADPYVPEPDTTPPYEGPLDSTAEPL